MVRRSVIAADLGLDRDVGEVPFRPVIFIECVLIDRETVWNVAKSGLQLGSLDCLLGGVLTGVNSDELDIFSAILLDVKVLNHKYDRHIRSLMLGAPAPHHKCRTPLQHN